VRYGPFFGDLVADERGIGVGEFKWPADGTDEQRWDVSDGNGGVDVQGVTCPGE
jgi:hypothetical protein